jgi:hypothetical protein
VSRAALDVTGIGNAVVDIIFRTDEAKIIRLEISKDTMTLINLERSEQLRQLTSPRFRLSGGSAGKPLPVLPPSEPRSDISERLGMTSSEMAFVMT